MTSVSSLHDREYPQNEKEARDYVLLLRDLRQGLDRLAHEKGIQLPQGFELTIAAVSHLRLLVVVVQLV
jgi:GH18 family chitinase